jgi:AsmA protein
MRATFLGLAVIAVIGAILILIGPRLISADEVRDKLLAQVETATGYRLRVSGPVSISLFPSIGLVADDVGVAKSGSTNMAEIARAKKLRFSLAVWPLLSGTVKVNEITLAEPLIALPATKAQAKAGGAESDRTAGNSAAAALKSLSLDKLLIKNGTVILPASGGIPGKRIEALNLEASLPSYDDKLMIAIDVVYDGQKVTGAGSIGSFGQFLEGTSVPLSLVVEAPSYAEQKIALSGSAAYKGDELTLSRFTAEAGENIVTGTATYANSTVTLDPFTGKAPGGALTGKVIADLSGLVPLVTATLAGQTLDLDKMMPKSGSANGPAARRSGDFGWSDAAIDFSPLKALNAKLQLSVGQLIYENVRLSSVGISATLAGGKLTGTVPSLKLYNGAGSASFAVDASSKAPTQAFKLSLANLDAYSFLKSVAGFESIEGTGAVAIDVTSGGTSQRGIIQSLSGTTKLEFTNGAIRGINVAKTVRSLSTGILSGWQESAAAKTDFAALGASFKIAQGQAQTQDLHLEGPLVRMTGSGTADLPGRALKFRVDPQVVASLEGQGGKTDLQGLGVPIIIAGPWAKPSIYPDIAGILQNPAAAYQQLNKLSGGLVSLKGAGALGSTGNIAGGLIQNGKINKDALKQGAIMGLGQLLGAPQPAGQAPIADQQPAGQAPLPAQ